MFLTDITYKSDILWDQIKFLTGTITYGGRVSDDIDRWLLLTLLDKFYNEFVLKDHFRFYQSDEYKLPKDYDKTLY